MGDGLSPYAIERFGPLSVCPVLSETLVYCDQMVGSITMLLGMEVGLDPGHIVLDGDPAPPKRGTAPNFRPMSVWPNGWMDQDATWYGGKRRLRDIVLFFIWGSSSQKGGHSTPTFG